MKLTLATEPDEPVGVESKPQHVETGIQRDARHQNRLPRLPSTGIGTATGPVTLVPSTSRWRTPPVPGAESRSSRV